MTGPKRLRLGALVLCVERYEPPRLWRVVGVEGEDAAAAAYAEAQQFLAGRVVRQGDLLAWCEKRLSLRELAAGSWGERRRR